MHVERSVSTTLYMAYGKDERQIDMESQSDYDSDNLNHARIVGLAEQLTKEIAGARAHDIRPRERARLTASIRDRAFNLANASLRWRFTVPGAMTRRLPISAFDRPVATSKRISL